MADPDHAEGYWLSDLERKQVLLWWQKEGRDYTTSGYGSKIPTVHMVRLPGDKRWRRVYSMVYGNGGTSYVLVKGARVIIH